ncbi:unnamed protein product [Gongylonema pulchrum]|uniref:TROVE domain-containing protein n=1 Tax=Gongylonema pulchrum TaxID=637853 RepID=A0A183D0W8_9BILA|nr:unnamed protein product [Gongylonema pulchrum]
MISGETGLKVKSKGWGRALRATVCRWYFSQSPERLVMQVTKYRNREGYSHRDIFRLSHIHASTALPPDHKYWQYHTEYDAIFDFIMQEDAATRKRKQLFSEKSAKKLKMEKNGSHIHEQAKDVAENLAKLKMKEDQKVLVESMKNKNAPTAETSKVLKFLGTYEKLKKLGKTDVPKAVDFIIQHGELFPACCFSSGLAVQFLHLVDIEIPYRLL